MSCPSAKTILVTGSNGFVAGLIVSLALEKGYNVRGSVRSESSGSKLKATFPGYAAQLSTTIVPDITVVESYEHALDDTITEVIHCASPFSLNRIVDIRAELLDPAIGGAVTILNAVQKYGKNVRRVVTTASFASSLDVLKGLRGGYTYDENDWNPMLYEEASTAPVAAAYSASKALAERAQWDWIEKNKPTFDLVALLPAWIFGPHAVSLEGLDHLNQSTSALWALVDNEEIPPPDFMGFVDSRDVAHAHIAALEKLEAGGERFILAQHFDYQSVADAVREELPEYASRIPKGTPGAGRQQVEDHGVYAINATKSETVLGLKYTSLAQSMKDSYLELFEAEKKSKNT